MPSLETLFFSWTDSLTPIINDIVIEITYLNPNKTLEC